jgi:hypothetical protein
LFSSEEPCGIFVAYPNLGKKFPFLIDDPPMGGILIGSPQGGDKISTGIYTLFRENYRF